tara:strand:+ start:11392 stop:12714 length:1323 start_codon:yes stop_codon:yes gene_type:complete
MILNHRLIINLLSYLLFLIPIALITGPFLPDLFLVIFSIIFLFTVIYRKEFSYLNNKFTYLFLFFYIYILILSLTSENVLLSLESSLFYFRFGIFALGIWYVLEHKKNFFNQFFFVLLLVFIVVIVDAYIQFFTGYNLLGFEKDKIRVSGFFNTELKLGSYLVRLYPIFFAISYTLSKNNNFYIYTAFLLFILVDVLIYLTGERTAFFLLFLHFLIIIFLIQGLRKLRLISFLLSLVIIIVLSYYFPNSKNRMIDDTLNQLNFDNVFSKSSSGINTENNVIDEGYVDFWNDIKLNQKRILAFSPHHELTYGLAFQIYKDNAVFGIGPKMFRQYCNYEKYYIQYGCTSHPHNTYIQLLVETGIFGFLYILSIFIFILFTYIRQFMSFLLKTKKINDNIILFLAPLFITLWPIVPSGNFFNNWLSIIYFLPIGFIIYFSKKN